MCGIVGYVGTRPAAAIVLEGLQRLEYRGYDSSGIAILGHDGNLVLRKSVGKLSRLIASLDGQPPEGCIGIGHTRWATHGKPSDENAHPHLDCSGQIVVIHNGIVENYVSLKSQLVAEGHLFKSQTDTEVLVHLLEKLVSEGNDLETSVRKMTGLIRGAHAIVAMRNSEPDKIVALRIGNAGGLVIGHADGEMYISSDLSAILNYTRNIVFLDSMEMATISRLGASYTKIDGSLLHKTPVTVAYDPIAAARGGYRHFMLKEIMEQPTGITDALRGRVEFDPPNIYLEDVPFTGDEIRSFRRIAIVACGTSYYAALVGKFMIEELAGIPVEVDYGSEFRYRQPLVDQETLLISITQSGETVDTLAAMEEAKARGVKQITICNVVGSQATRLADGVIHTHAGLEVGVAATKSFTTQLVALYLLALYLGQVRGKLDETQMQAHVDDLARLPNLVGNLLANDNHYQQLAHRFFECRDFLFLGRGINYPIALEGALKLKEISYIHAEGYPAGEMKHGPIALIDEKMPIVVIAVEDRVYEKVLSNVEEVRARDGIVIALATEGDEVIKSKSDHVLWVPKASRLLNPILTVVPLQLLAYHIAVRRGCDVDQPKNLAKSVTVE
ncbi:MAG: glutamine--fructose-6-phosphate transaminase (isomerizing) [Dehalococcoidia bacterium]|nr:glutamine--fructose-6-phosphate transaminase (isomerizing) [Dehalococcoidia bacterium]